MCGIMAMYSAQGPISAAALEQAIQLTHRGPDGQRTWVSGDRRVGLGHARLSIIDLATGDQPIASEDERLRIVVNGEFYDFERIQRELESRGHRLRTRSDSEIALHLYEDLGTACLRHLRGEFAFALWDGPNDTLFAARDRFGIKPLYYAHHEGTLYLASEIKALFAAGVPARWDRAAFFQANHFLVTPQGRTLFDGIYQVPPGHFLLANGEQVRLVRYWDFDYPTADEDRPAGPDAEYAERFRARARRGGPPPAPGRRAGRLLPERRARLVRRAGPGGDAPKRSDPGLHADLRPARLRRGSHRPRDGGARRGRVPPDPDPAIRPRRPLRRCDLAGRDALRQRAWRREVPAEPGRARRRLQGRADRRGLRRDPGRIPAISVATWCCTTRRDRIRRPSGCCWSSWRRATRSRAACCCPTARRRRWRACDAPGVRALVAGGHRHGRDPFRALFAPDFAAEFAGRDAYRVLLNGLDVPGQLAGREPVNQSLYLWSKAMLPNYVLTVLGDRMEMAHSVEGRLPFLDHHVVELARDLPISQKIRGMTEKYVLREAARPVLTATVYGRHKHPFLTPPSALSPGERLHELVQGSLRGPALASLPFYDQAKVVALLDALPTLSDDTRTAFDPVLMMLLSACGLHERYKL